MSSASTTLRRAADQRRARQIGLQSLGIGLVSAGAALLLPT
jgi:hypothetical protein